MLVTRFPVRFRLFRVDINIVNSVQTRTYRLGLIQDRMIRVSIAILVQTSAKDLAVMCLAVLFRDSTWRAVYVVVARLLAGICSSNWKCSWYGTLELHIIRVDNTCIYRCCGRYGSIIPVLASRYCTASTVCRALAV